MIRFRGGGVGHKSTREATDFFKKDRDRLDMTSNHDDDDEVMEEEDFGELQPDELKEDEEDDFGYTMSQSDEDKADEGEAIGYGHGDSDSDVYFGPEDDGGAVDPDMDEFVRICNRRFTHRESYFLIWARFRAPSCLLSKYIYSTYSSRETTHLSPLRRTEVSYFIFVYIPVTYTYVVYYFLQVLTIP
jgi:hypothetical protein